MQKQKSSETRELVSQIGQIAEKRELDLIETNLRDGVYWWPTRLYLLAALADEYTSIKNFVFVDGVPERHFIGMATPRATRKAMAEAFVEEQYEEKYCRTQGLRKLSKLRSQLD